MTAIIDNDTEPKSERVQNRYSLVVLAAKRAKQIKEGAPPLIITESTNALTIALEEIAAGKINYIEAPEPVEDEVRAPVTAAAPPPAPAQPSALQMLTESLDQAERASQRDTQADADEMEAAVDADLAEDGSDDTATETVAAEEE